MTIEIHTDFLNLRSRNFKDIYIENEFTDDEKRVLKLILIYFNKSIHDIESIDYDEDKTFWIEFDDFGSIIKFDEIDDNMYNVYNKRVNGELICSFKII